MNIFPLYSSWVWRGLGMRQCTSRSRCNYRPGSCR